MNRYIDASGGPILCSLGHGLDEMAKVLGAQAKKLSYVHRIDFTNPPLEKAAQKVCKASNYAMDKVFFVSGGTEAVEIGVKIARKYHLDNGKPSKTCVTSRWQSYHGSTAGVLAWTGSIGRRSDFFPYLNDSHHIPPAYCYRCWFNKIPETCSLECANALENEIMCLGPDNVSVFLAEPVSGMSLCGVVPAKGYFERIRAICNKYDVLLMFDEVMTGTGRTGKMFAYEHFNVVPDILALGKGLGGGYFPLGAVAVPGYIYKKNADNSGMFIEYSGGCDRGQSGDMIMFGPPFIINEAQIDEAVEILRQALDEDLLSDDSNFLTF